MANPSLNNVSLSRKLSAVGWIQMCLQCLRVQDLWKEAGNIHEAKVETPKKPTNIRQQQHTSNP